MSDAKEKWNEVVPGTVAPHDPVVLAEQAVLRATVISKRLSLKQYLEMAPLEGVDLTRSKDTGRDVEL